MNMKKYNQYIKEQADDEDYSDEVSNFLGGIGGDETVCPQCHGNGDLETIDDICPTCGGEGYLYDGAAMTSYSPYNFYPSYGNSVPSTFKEGEDICYMKDKSKHHGKSGTFLKIREDGKYSLKFDDGTRFAAEPKYVFGLKRMKKT